MWSILYRGVLVTEYRYIVERHSLFDPHKMCDKCGGGGALDTLTNWIAEHSRSKPSLFDKCDISPDLAQINGSLKC